VYERIQESKSSWFKIVCTRSLHWRRRSCWLFAARHCIGPEQSVPPQFAMDPYHRDARAI
jgi:hypothetical protein